MTARALIHQALRMAGYSPAQADARISAFEAEAAEPAPCPVCEGWGAYCDEHRPSHQSVDFVREERP